MARLAQQARAEQARAAREAAAVAERTGAASEMAVMLKNLCRLVEEDMVEPDRARTRAGRILGNVADAAARRQGALSLPAAVRRVLGITDDGMLGPAPRVPCAQSAVSLAFVQRFYALHCSLIAAPLYFAIKCARGALYSRDAIIGHKCGCHER